MAYVKVIYSDITLDGRKYDKLCALIDDLIDNERNNIVIFTHEGRREHDHLKANIRIHLEEKYTMTQAVFDTVKYKEGLCIKFWSLIRDPFPRGINFDTLIYLSNHPLGDHMKELIPVALTLEAKIFVKQEDEFIDFGTPMIKSAHKS